MKKLPWKTACIAAALVAALALTVSAALVLLSPAQVAERVGDPVLADAFASADAIDVNEAETVGDYTVTFMGLVSGTHLSQYDVKKESTYAVLACRRTGGADITDNVPEVTVTPLVEGFAPWDLNAWTLSGGTVSFAQDGVLYYLFSCDTPAPCDGGNVYLAVYPGSHMPPDARIFSFDAATGAIAFQPGQEGVLFPLPLS